MGERGERWEGNKSVNFEPGHRARGPLDADTYEGERSEWRFQARVEGSKRWWSGEGLADASRGSRSSRQKLEHIAACDGGQGGEIRDLGHQQQVDNDVPRTARAWTDLGARVLG